MTTDQEDLESDDGALHAALVENTTQTVRKHLNELVNEEQRFRRRWIWELLQNARDVAQEGGVRVTITEERGTFRFRHDGRPFTKKDVAHLIYHGSTKHDPSVSVGRYGTGFITTHILSRVIHVRGVLNTELAFSFTLDRRGDDDRTLQQAMDASWVEYIASRQPLGGARSDTEYSYPLTDDVVPLIADGIRELHLNTPFVLAFNPAVQSLCFSGPEGNREVRTVGRVPLAEGLERLEIEDRSDGSALSRRFLVVMSAATVSIALELRQDADSWAVSAPVDCPRLYVAFPLSASHGFSFPAVVNSLRFTPREARDALPLVGEGDANQNNRRLIEEACDLLGRLTDYAASEAWGGLACLGAMPDPQNSDWVDITWLRSMVAKRIVAPLRKKPILTTDCGVRIAPEAASIPQRMSGLSAKQLWDLAAPLRKLQSTLPTRAEVEMWSSTLATWALAYDQPVKDFTEALTLTHLCKQAAEAGSVAALRAALTDVTDPLEWLRWLCKAVVETNSKELFDLMSLLPSQAGVLAKRKTLKRDDGIDEELKDIAECLELKPRLSLLNQGFDVPGIVDLLEPWNTQELLTQMLRQTRLIERELQRREGARDGVLRFFAWLVAHGRMDLLEGFPVFTQAALSVTEGVRTLKRLGPHQPEAILVPVQCWPSEAQGGAVVFPPSRILHDDYTKLVGPETWPALAQERYVFVSPLHERDKRIEAFLPDEPFPEQDGKNRQHRSVNPVKQKVIMFLEDEDGVLTSVRKSPTRAIELLRFIVGYVMTVDAGALEIASASCECGITHNYYVGAWLVPMSRSRWVPLADLRQGLPQAETIAHLVRGNPEATALVTAGHGARLMKALNISVADLMCRTVADDEATRVAYINCVGDMMRAVGDDMEAVQSVIDELRRSPELIVEIETRRQQRAKVHRNREVGALVEQMLLETLRELPGLRVTRTGIGSDYEVEHDYIENGREMAIEVSTRTWSCLIELKATTVGAVRMTVSQARTAVEERGRFALCVVVVNPADITKEAVIRDARLVLDIGNRIEPVWTGYQQLDSARASARQAVKGITLIIEQSQTRFAVEREAWTAGLSLAEFVKWLATPANHA